MPRWLAKNDDVPLNWSIRSRDAVHARSGADPTDDEVPRIRSGGLQGPGEDHDGQLQRKEQIIHQTQLRPPQRSSGEMLKPI